MKGFLVTSVGKGDHVQVTPRVNYPGGFAGRDLPREGGTYAPSGIVAATPATK
jgi:hypothetical protein